MRDYVNLGRHQDWEGGKNGRLPKSIAFSDGQRCSVEKETSDYMCRGLNFDPFMNNHEISDVRGKLNYSDRTQETVVIHVITVY